MHAPSKGADKYGAWQIDWFCKFGIATASALRVISISLAHTLPSFYFDGNMCKLETENIA
jgi:hypothetical protein